MDDSHGGTCTTCGKAAICSGQDPEHIIEIRHDGWTLQHSLACRLEGNLFDCQVNRAVEAWVDNLIEPPTTQGRFYVTATNGDPHTLKMRVVE